MQSVFPLLRRSEPKLVGRAAEAAVSHSGKVGVDRGNEEERLSHVEARAQWI